MKYKFRRFQHISDWKWLVFIPTVIFIKDDLMYVDQNFSLQFHFLGWHLAWKWFAERED